MFVYFVGLVSFTQFLSIYAQTCTYAATGATDLAVSPVRAVYPQRTQAQCETLCTNQKEFTCYGFVFLTTNGVCYMYSSADLGASGSKQKVDPSLIQQYKKTCGVESTTAASTTTSTASSTSTSSESTSTASSSTTGSTESSSTAASSTSSTSESTSASTATSSSGSTSEASSTTSGNTTSGGSTTSSSQTQLFTCVPSTHQCKQCTYGKDCPAADSGTELYDSTETCTEFCVTSSTASSSTISGTSSSTVATSVSESTTTSASTTTTTAAESTTTTTTVATTTAAKDVYLCVDGNCYACNGGDCLTFNNTHHKSPAACEASCTPTSTSNAYYCTAQACVKCAKASCPSQVTLFALEQSCIDSCFASTRAPTGPPNFRYYCQGTACQTCNFPNCPQTAGTLYATAGDCSASCSTIKYKCSNGACLGCQGESCTTGGDSSYATQHQCQTSCAAVAGVTYYTCKDGSCATCTSADCPNDQTRFGTEALCKEHCLARQYICVGNTCVPCTNQLNCPKQYKQYATKSACQSSCGTATSPLYYCDETTCERCVGNECDRNVHYYTSSNCDRECDYGCNNAHQNCVSWAAQGECVNNPGGLRKYCRASCRTCYTAFPENLPANPGLSGAIPNPIDETQSTAQPQGTTSSGSSSSGSPSGTCVDTNVLCNFWQENKTLCNGTAAQRAFMLRNCSASCSGCHPIQIIPAPACEDLNENCADWAAQGECTSNKHFMRWKCGPTCNLCETNSATGGSANSVSTNGGGSSG